MTKILYINGAGERAGAERILYSLLKHLDRSRFEPHVLFLQDGPFVQEVSNLDVPVSVITSGRLRQVWTWPAVVRAIRAKIEEIQAQVVQATGEKVSLFSCLAAKKSGVPAVAWLHDSPGAGGASGWAVQWLLSKISGKSVVTCSRWMSDEFNRRFGMKATPIVNSIDLDVSAYGGGSMDQLKRELGWPNDAVVVGHFARLQRWKGTTSFVNAAAALKDELPMARFLVVGDVMIGRELGYGEELRNQARALGLDGYLVFTGYREDAVDLMAGTDVVVHCSLKPDPFPTVVLEGMALGRPVIATRSRGPEEAIADGETGILVDPGDETAIAQAIRKLVGSEETRKLLGQRAAEAAQAYTGSRMADEFADLYQCLANDVQAVAS